MRIKRKALKLSQARLAKLVGFKNQSSISAIELNQHSSSPRILRLAEVLNTTPEYLLYGHSEKLHVASPVAPYNVPTKSEELKLLKAFRRLSKSQQEKFVADVERLATANDELLQELLHTKSNGTDG